MKKTLFTLACVALVAPAFADEVAPITINLCTTTGSNLVGDSGIQIGGIKHSGADIIGQVSTLNADSDFNAWKAAIGNDELKWYTNSRNSDVEKDTNYATPNTVSMVLDGPSGKTHMLTAGFAYTLSNDVVLSLKEDSEIKVAFNICVAGGNNNGKGESIAAQVLTSYGSSNTVEYVNTAITDTSAADLTMTLGADVVNAMKNAGGDQTFIVRFYDPNQHDTRNEIYRVKDITLSYVPEPATATLSLLALAGLASRRRRHHPIGG